MWTGWLWTGNLHPKAYCRRVADGLRTDGELVVGCTLVAVATCALPLWGLGAACLKQPASLRVLLL